MPCNCCELTDRTFSEPEAIRELKSYAKNGPARQTGLILEAVRDTGLKDAALLDIGGGIGAIHHELLGEVAREAIHVDASSAYLKQAKAEAARRGHSEQVRFIHADFTDVAADVPETDIVTLDRVVCCYPDFRGLLKAAAAHSRKVLALTYPRETWYIRMVLGGMNLFQRLRKDPFRVFVHPVPEMDSLIKREGFERVTLRRLFVWEMALYRRISATESQRH
ncbi:MAG TPA: class I SAM-dependent methyltransferase [Anaerolineales bacterium]|nr:class I SAM-dependent methyltransferase [Anaerolineales bacterium]